MIEQGYLQIESSDYLDNFLAANFFKCVINKYLGNLSEAKNYAIFVLEK